MTGSMPAAAQEQRWAVLSLVGDRLTVVAEQPRTGTHLPANKTEEVALPDDAFDRVVAGAIIDAASGHGLPGTMALAIRDARLYALQERLLIAPEAAALRDAITGAARGAGASHLVLVTRLRDEFFAELTNGRTGLGPVAGLGFYLNRSTPLRSETSGRQGTGYLAPFTYIRLQLVELATGAVLGEQRVTRSALFPVQAMHDDDPWARLSARQKIDTLQKLLTSGMREAVPALAESRR